MKALLDLITAHRAAWTAWSQADDDAPAEQFEEINMQVSFASHALLKHRPATLAEVTVKAAYMSANNGFTDWDEFGRKALIEAFLVVGDLGNGGARETTAPSTDPIVFAIATYRSEVARYNVLAAGKLSSEQYDALAEQTFIGPLKALERWTEPALTHDGAISALRAALDETKGFACSEVIPPMIEAALAYLHRQGTERASR